MKALLIIWFVFFGFISNAQITFYQDVCKCGVTGAGFSSGQGTGGGNIVLNINPNSVIKKAFAFTYSQRDIDQETFAFNGSDITFDETNIITEVEYSPPWAFASPSKLYFKDITTFISNNQNSYSLILPENAYNQINKGFWSYYVLVIYENPILQNTSFSIFTNNLDFTGNENYNFSDINPIINSYPTGLSIYTDRMGDMFNLPNHNVYINDSIIGTIGGSDLINSNWNFAGVKGHFYYQNNLLFGLDDDTADPFMAGTDGLADISNYIQNLTTNFNFQIKHLNYPTQPENFNSVNLAYFLTYTSTCEAFPVTVSTDTTICRNETVQLSASGGTQYLWQPSIDLSCVYCPNPVFSGDSSRFYTVRIWNNDSCSVVRPVKVNVRQLPAFSTITSTPSDCNGATGKIISSANLSGETYSLNGGTPQNSGNFFNLAPRDYTLSLHELNGCTKDTVITVGSTISTDAFFTATPAQGAPPLWVNFTNLSENASNYAWFLNDDPQGNSFPSHLFDSTGNYTVTLVAWPNNPSCTDSFSLQIYVFDSLIVQVPNVFTPNNDQSNDVFGITTNSPVTVEYQLFNRWGNEMISGKNSLGNTTPLGLTFTPLWDGNNATEGTYFYQLTVTAQTPKGEQQRRLEGFFVLMR